MKTILHPALARRAQRGIVVIELAFVSFLYIVLILAAFVLGRAVFQYNVVAAAVAEGGRYLSAGPWSQARQDDAEQLICDMAADAGVSGITFSQPVCLPLGQTGGCANPNTVELILSAQVPFTDPTQFVLPDSWATTVTVTVRPTH